MRKLRGRERKEGMEEKEDRKWEWRKREEEKKNGKYEWRKQEDRKGR